MRTSPHSLHHDRYFTPCSHSPRFARGSLPLRALVRLCSPSLGPASAFTSSAPSISAALASSRSMSGSQTDVICHRSRAPRVLTPKLPPHHHHHFGAAAAIVIRRHAPAAMEGFQGPLDHHLGEGVSATPSVVPSRTEDDKFAAESDPALGALAGKLHRFAVRNHDFSPRRRGSTQARPRRPLHHRQQRLGAHARGGGRR